MKKYTTPPGTLPCPFCSSRKLSIYSHIDNLVIECICGARISKGMGIKVVEDEDVKKLIGKWNNRIGGTDK